MSRDSLDCERARLLNTANEESAGLLNPVLPNRQTTCQAPCKGAAWAGSGQRHDTPWVERRTSATPLCGECPADNAGHHSPPWCHHSLDSLGGQREQAWGAQTCLDQVDDCHQLQLAHPLHLACLHHEAWYLQGLQAGFNMNATIILACLWQNSLP